MEVAQWTKEARIQHVPRKERYPSDITDTEWAIIAPLIPPQRPGGRHRETDMREAMNAVRYVLRTGFHQRDPVGYDAAKKTKGIKRNVIVDTIGLLLGIAVIPADTRTATALPT